MSASEPKKKWRFPLDFLKFYEYGSELKYKPVTFADLIEEKDVPKDKESPWYRFGGTTYAMLKGETRPYGGRFFKVKKKVVLPKNNRIFPWLTEEQIEDLNFIGLDIETPTWYSSSPNSSLTDENGIWSDEINKPKNTFELVMSDDANNYVNNGVLPDLPDVMTRKDDPNGDYSGRSFVRGGGGSYRKIYSRKSKKSITSRRRRRNSRKRRYPRRR